MPRGRGGWLTSGEWQKQSRKYTDFSQTHPRLHYGTPLCVRAQQTRTEVLRTPYEWNHAHTLLQGISPAGDLGHSPNPAR